MNRRSFASTLAAALASTLAFLGWRGKACAVIDTTTQLNEKWRTYSPPRHVSSPKMKDGYFVQGWPEYQALERHLGVRIGFTLKVTIDEVLVDGRPVRYPGGGFGLYRAPEFVVLCERLGVPLEFYTRWQEFKFGEGELPVVTHNYVIVDKNAVGARSASA